MWIESRGMGSGAAFREREILREEGTEGMDVKSRMRLWIWVRSRRWLIRDGVED